MQSLLTLIFVYKEDVRPFLSIELFPVYNQFGVVIIIANLFLYLPENYVFLLFEHLVIARPLLLYNL